MKSSNRRDFLQALAGGITVLSAVKTAPRGWAQGNAAPLLVSKLNETFSLISGAGSNVLVLTGPDSVLLVDGGSTERSEEVLKLAGEVSGGRPVRVLFNTHWHPESTGSNDTLGKAGARIISHENTRLWMGAEFHVQWQNRTYKPRAKEARPNDTFYSTGKMTFGKEEILYGSLGQAHTDGDIYVFFPGANILATGDVFTVGSYPIADWSTGGWVGSYNDTTKLPVGGLGEACYNLARIGNAQTRVIPGSGPVQSKADLQAHSDMCSAMSKRFVDMMRKGMSARDMFLAAPTREFDARYGDPRLYIATAYPGLWNHVRELGGIV